MKIRDFNNFGLEEQFSKTHNTGSIIIAPNLVASSSITIVLHDKFPFKNTFLIDEEIIRTIGKKLINIARYVASARGPHCTPFFLVSHRFSLEFILEERLESYDEILKFPLLSMLIENVVSVFLRIQQYTNNDPQCLAELLLSSQIILLEN